jgi:hypothetical protein
MVESVASMFARRVLATIYIPQQALVAGVSPLMMYNQTRAEHLPMSDHYLGVLCSAEATVVINLRSKTIRRMTERYRRGYHYSFIHLILLGRVFPNSGLELGIVVFQLLLSNRLHKLVHLGDLLVCPSVSTVVIDVRKEA